MRDILKISPWMLVIASANVIAMLWKVMDEGDLVFLVGRKTNVIAMEFSVSYTVYIIVLTW